ncbi:MAG: serine hydrolase domain-containing protein [Clostridia bacterium]
MRHLAGTCAQILTVTFVIAFLVCSFSPAVGAGDEQTISMDALLEEHLRENRLPGGAAAVVRPDGSMHLYARGNASADVPMTPDTPVYIASISKSFTAVAIMQLVERDLLDLDEPVVNYLPEFSVADPEVTEQITARHLLTHTSGLSERTYTEDLPVDAEIADSVAALSEAVPVAEPGEHFAYFNPGYSVLGLLIEEVSGVDYGKYLSRNIFEPLNMWSTFTDPEEAEEAGLATGHTPYFGWPVASGGGFLRHALPAGFIISTSRDMGRYGAALLAGGSLGYADILSTESVEKLWRVPEEGEPYGMGWSVLDEEGERIVNHGGSLPGYSSQMVLLPDRETGALLLFNGNHLLYGMTAHGTLVEEMADVLRGREPEGGSAVGTLAIASLVVFVLVVGTSLWSTFGLPHWRRNVGNYSRWKIIRDIFVPLAGSIAALTLPPWLMKTASDRAVTWEIFFSLAPDLGLTFLIPAVLGISVGLVRLMSAIGVGLAQRRRQAAYESGASESTQDSI